MNYEFDKIPKISEHSIENYTNEEISLDELFEYDMINSYTPIDEKEFWEQFNDLSSEDREGLKRTYEYELHVAYELEKTFNIEEEEQKLKEEQESENNKLEEYEINNDKLANQTFEKYFQLYETGVIDEKYITDENFNPREQRFLYKRLQAQIRYNQTQIQVANIQEKIIIEDKGKLDTIAEYLIRNWGLFQDIGKRKLFISNLESGYTEFKITAQNNWWKRINYRLYQLKTNRDGTTYFKKVTVQSNELENQLIQHVDVLKSPIYNKISFKNGIYNSDTNLLETKGNVSLYTKLNIPYNYNPQANGGKLEKWLKEAVFSKNPGDLQGLFEYIGYVIIEPGHKKHQWMLFIFGAGGTGKSMLLRIISKAIGDENCCTINLPKILKGNDFEYAGIVNKTLIRIEEIDGNKVENFAWFKEHTGGGPISIEQKGKQSFQLASEDIGHIIGIGNRIMQTDNMDKSFLRRLLLLEFTYKPTIEERNNNVNFENEILEDKEGLEWLIYNSIQAYQDMIKNKRNPVLLLNEEENETKLLKLHKQELYLINKYCQITDTDIEDVPLTKRLFFKLMNYFAENEPIDIKQQNSPAWKKLIKEFTGNYLNDNNTLKKRQIKKNRYPYWIDLDFKPEVYEEYCRICPDCGEYTLKDNPCIYGCDDKD